MTSQPDASHPEERVPVLIVGGSLVGLSASLFLGRLGIDHLLVERHARTSHHPRGRGNNVRTMELYRTAGIEPLIREAASVLKDNHGILQADTIAGAEQEWLFRTIDPGGALSRLSPSGWCLCSQNDLEPVLLRAAQDLGGDIRFNTELISSVPDADGVTCEVTDRATGAVRTVRADYLVAADGPRSPVRERLGIPMTGPGDLFHNVSITFRAKKLADAVGDRRFIVCYLTNPDSPGALLPVDNTENWVFHAPWKPEDGETLEDFTDERCADLIRTAAGVRDMEVEITGKAPWHAAERVAARYGHGRVLLAGDSAHEMSPTGAFGSNTGIQDAHNLAWKLAAVLRGWAGPGLIDTYDAERRPVALATAARASSRSAEHSHPGYDVSPSTGPRPGMMAVVLGYRYPAGAVVGVDPERPPVPEEFSPLAVTGGRAPHLCVRWRADERGPGVGGRGTRPPAEGPRRKTDQEERIGQGKARADQEERIGQGKARADQGAARADERGPGVGGRGRSAGGERISTLDLYERDPVLLVGPSGAAWHEAAPRAAERTGVPLRSYLIGVDLVVEDFPAGKPGGPAGPPPGKPGGAGGPLRGADGPDGPAGTANRARVVAAAGPPDFGRLHGVGDDGAVLVRPDGFVAWRAEGADADPEGTLERVLREVFRLP